MFSSEAIYKELAHAIMESKKSRGLQPASQEGVSGIVPS